MRKKPYTAIGILRIPCSVKNCRKKSVHQWQCCALENLYMPLCTAHDIGLNEVAVRYILGDKKSLGIIKRYRNKLIPLDNSEK